LKEALTAQIRELVEASREEIRKHADSSRPKVTSITDEHMLDLDKEVQVLTDPSLCDSASLKARYDTLKEKCDQAKKEYKISLQREVEEKQRELKEMED
jgi:hypothetical protein